MDLQTGSKVRYADLIIIIIIIIIIIFICLQNIHYYKYGFVTNFFGT